MRTRPAHSSIQVLAWLCSVSFVLLLSACSSTGTSHPRPTPAPYPRYSPVPPQPPPPPPAAAPCTVHFDPCSCDLSQFKIQLLDERLEYPGDTEATAANLRRTANDYKNAYWSTRQQETGLFALRFYDGYLKLVPLSNSFAPFALLHSISLYCGLGCTAKAEDLARELRSNYSFDRYQIEKALSYCR